MITRRPTPPRATRDRRRALAACALLAVLAIATAATANSAPETPPSYAPPDELGRGTPRGTVTGFLEATSARDYARAARYLDLRRVPRGESEQRGAELARQLRLLLDNSATDLGALPDDPEGRGQAGIPAGHWMVARVEAGGVVASIDLARGRREDGVLIWRFSDSTLALVPGLYQKLSYGIVGAWLPPFLVETRVLGLALWQWLGLVALTALSLLVATLLVRPRMPLTRWLLRRAGISSDGPTFGRAVGPLRILVALAAFKAGQASLALPQTAEPFVNAIQKLLIIAVVGWLASRLIEALCGLARRRLSTHEETATVPLVDFGQRALQIMLAVLLVLLVLQAVGVRVSALVAAVGVGGIGIALAAQRIVENLFAGLALMGDRPVRVGDLCRFGDRLGTVERIGLWSTRIRTPERSVVAIANAQFIALQIENLQQRDRLLFGTTLRLPYETGADQLRWLLVTLREMLYAHPRVDPVPARVRLASFGPSALEIEIFAYVRTTDAEDFLAVREDLLLRIMDVVREAGTAPALPFQTSSDGADGRDPERAARAVAEVERWRREGRLPLPEFPPERIRALRAEADRRSG